MGFFQDLRTEIDETMDRMQADARREQYLSAHGHRGTATITALRETGTFVNENPEVEMDLEVSIDGMATYSAKHRQVIAVVAAPRFRLGSTVAVRVDPGEPTSLTLA